MRAILAATLGLAALLAAAPALAQPPGPPDAQAALNGPCPDHLRAARIQLDATTLSEIRGRADAAQALARQQKDLEALRARVADLERQLAAAKKPVEGK